MTPLQHRRLVCAVMAVVATVTGMGPAVAQTYGIDFRNTLMPASGGMAGTSVAAPQDFLSAINANPAALTQYKGTHFTLGGAFAEATVDLEQKTAVPLLGWRPSRRRAARRGPSCRRSAWLRRSMGFPYR